MIAKTVRSMPGSANASCAADARPFVEQHPVRDHEECDAGEQDEKRVEQAANGAVRRRVRSGSEPHTATCSASSRLALRTSGCEPSGRVSTTERTQLLGDERLDVRAVHVAVHRRRHARRDLVHRAGAVDGGQHRVEQRRQLQDLAVRALDERRRHPVAGPALLAEELDAGGAGRHLLRRLGGSLRGAGARGKSGHHRAALPLGGARGCRCRTAAARRPAYRTFEMPESWLPVAVALPSIDWSIETFSRRGPWRASRPCRCWPPRTR